MPFGIFRHLMAEIPKKSWLWGKMRLFPCLQLHSWLFSMAETSAGLSHESCKIELSFSFELLPVSFHFNHKNDCFAH